MTTQLPTDLVDRKEAASLVDRSVSTIRAWIRNGDLPSYKLDDKPNSPVLVSKAELLHYVGTTKEVAPPRPGSAQPEVDTEDLQQLRLDKVRLEGQLSASVVEKATLERLITALQGQVQAEKGRAESLERVLEERNGEVASLRATLEVLRANGERSWFQRLFGPAPAIVSETPEA